MGKDDGQFEKVEWKKIYNRTDSMCQTLSVERKLWGSKHDQKETEYFITTIDMVV
jgi:hypothetical protein